MTEAAENAQNRVLPFILLGGKALYREYDIQRLLETNYRKADV